jgi:hypothetical protein
MANTSTWVSQNTVNPPPDTDRDAFSKWLVKQYGLMASAIALSYKSYKDLPEYIWWSNNGRPNNKVQVPSTFRTQTSSVAPTTPITSTAPTSPAATHVTANSSARLPEIVSIGGYDYEVQRDADGKITGYAPKDRTITDQNGMTDYQRATLQMQADQNKLQSDWSANDKATAAYLSTLGNSEKAQQDRTNQVLADQWDTMQQQILAQTQASPRDWITHFNAKSMANPYKPKPETAQDDIRRTTEELKTAQSMEQSALDSWKSLSNRVGDNYAIVDSPQVQGALQRYNDAVARRVALEDYVNQQTQAWKASPDYANAQPVQSIVPNENGLYNSSIGGAETPVEQPKGAPIPSWLQEVSGLTGTVPKGRVEVQRPSAQMWSSLLPEQKRMYEGLVNQSGKDTYASTLDQMGMEVPLNPQLGNRWKPARQYI